ncbi:MAG: beta-lactamase family protein [Ignavibacteria bacterium]|nr:MAG: beta-lactamase family protein [Ignavibacteria bacterium]
MRVHLSSMYLAFILTIVLRVFLTAQVALPDTPAGKVAKQYIDAFNSGDDAKLRQFFIDNVAPKGLAERPVEARLERAKQFRQEAKSLTPQKILDTGPNSLGVVARAGNGDILTLTFEFDTTALYKLAGLRVDLGEQEATSSPATMGQEEFGKFVGDYLAQSVRDDKFSGAVLVVHDTTVMLKKAYGDAEKGFHVPNGVSTRFNLGSINKFFTRLAIAQLAEAGKLSLDKPVIDYLPDYPNKSIAARVTIEQLLAMKSGMGNIFGEKFEATPKNKIRTLNDYLQLFVDDTLLFEPGSRRQYSNAGYVVLGLIVERLSGEDYYSYVSEHIFTPAAMNNSGWFPSNAMPANTAIGYTHPRGQDQAWKSNTSELPGRGSSAGGGYSTLDDMRSFVRALLNGKLISARYSEWMLTGVLPQTDPPLPLKQGGMGLAGGVPGVNALLDFSAETGNIVVVLANYDPPAAEAVGKRIRDAMKGVKWERL